MEERNQSCTTGHEFPTPREPKMERPALQLAKFSDSCFFTEERGCELA